MNRIYFILLSFFQFTFVYSNTALGEFVNDRGQLTFETGETLGTKESNVFLLVKPTSSKQDEWKWQTHFEIIFKYQAVGEIIIQQKNFSQEFIDRSRSFYADESYSNHLRIGKIEVDKNFQGLGIASEAISILLQLYSSQASQVAATSFKLEFHGSNNAAVALWKKMGFLYDPDPIWGDLHIALKRIHPEGTCLYCGLKTNKMCHNCGQKHFCSPEHRRFGWKLHRSFYCTSNLKDEARTLQTIPDNLSLQYE